MCGSNTVWLYVIIFVFGLFLTLKDYSKFPQFFYNYLHIKPLVVKRFIPSLLDICVHTYSADRILVSCVDPLLCYS